MRFQPLLLGAAVAAFLFTGNSQANELRKVFDYYAQGSPGTYSTSGMKHWQGASFSGRNALSEPTLYQLPTVNLGGSCKGIDFHAGGFGLVTKDELVQMARGIAQGAPGYFFNMAIGAVCSSCLQNINEFMRKLEKYNELAKNSCENFWNTVTNTNGEPFDRARANAEHSAKLLDQATGTMNQWADDLAKYYNATEAGKSVAGASTGSAQKVLNENVVYRRIRSSFDGNYHVQTLPGADITTAELAMSLFGTVITRVIPDTTDKIEHATKPSSKGLEPLSLMFGPKTGEDIYFYKCVPEAVNDELKECLDLEEKADADFKGLVEKFKTLLVGTTAAPGIITKIHRRENLDPTTEVPFITAFQMPYLKIAANKSERVREQLGERFALMIAQKIVHDIYNETSAVLWRALKAPRTSDDNLTVDYRKDIKEGMERAERDVKAMDERVRIELDAIDKTLVSNLAAAQLAQLDEENLGLR